MLNRSTESISVFAIFDLGITTFFCGIQNTINVVFGTFNDNLLTSNQS